MNLLITCNLFPDIIVQYFKYVSNLKFNGMPDYDYVRQLLKNTLHSLGKKDEGKLEFETKTYEIELDLDISSDAEVNVFVECKPSEVEN